MRNCTSCPSCQQLLAAQTFAGNYGKTVSLDLCYACQSMWFDSQESLRLSPQAILHLFRIIHEQRAEHRPPLPKHLPCPRCGRRLTHTTDRQRNIQFYYFACEQEHGRFITFFQFLREKNFVRSLTPKEVKELKTHLTTLNCSNCGAPVDMDKTSGCTYCHTPISMIDPQQVKNTLQELKRKEDKQQAVDQSRHSALVFERLRAEAETRLHRTHANTTDPIVWEGAVDLVGAGISTLLDAFLDIG